MPACNHLYKEMSVGAQTAFANLERSAKERELSRSLADIAGGFTKKNIKGSIYWYYQTKDPNGRPQQVYLGPDDSFMQSFMATRNNPVRKTAAAHLSRLSASAVALGCTAITPKHGRVIKRIAECGFFKASGVLAGTHAFLSYQNMLGVTWGVGDVTMDLDFAHPGNNLSIAMPDQLRIDVKSAIESLQMGFIPVHGQARFKKQDEPDFDVDFLTTLTRVGNEPIQIKSLGIFLQPLKFMELALENSVQSIILLNNGPLVVNVPSPEYFALHKLIVSIERQATNPIKAVKDATQSGALIHYFLNVNCLPLIDAYKNIISRGPCWKSRLAQGLNSLDKVLPDQHLKERLLAAVLEFDQESDDGETDEYSPSI